MNSYGLAPLALGLLLIASQAQTLTLTNMDDVEYEIQVNVSKADGSDLSPFTILPAQTIDDICAVGCTLILNTGVKNEFDGDEVVEIKEGEFVFPE